jgi:hypothetical protein
MIPLYFTCFVWGLICMIASGSGKNLVTVIANQIYLFMVLFGLSGMIWMFSS